jgi:hypothetical protein
MRRLIHSLDRRAKLALLIALPAMFGIARCNTPYGHREMEEPEPVAIYPDHDFTRWTVDERGLGPLRAGLALPQAGVVLKGAITIAEGEESNLCGYADWPTAPAGVFILVEQGIISRIEVDSASVPTSAGARVGDTEARIDSLYRGRVERQLHPYTDGRYLIVRAPVAEDAGDYRIVFETDGRRVTKYRAGRYPAVSYAEACEVATTE